MAIALLITFALSPWVGRLRKLGFRYDRNLITALTGPIGPVCRVWPSSGPVG